MKDLSISIDRFISRKGCGNCSYWSNCGHLQGDSAGFLPFEDTKDKVVLDSLPPSFSLTTKITNCTSWNLFCSCRCCAWNTESSDSSAGSVYVSANATTRCTRRFVVCTISISCTTYNISLSIWRCWKNSCTNIISNIFTVSIVLNCSWSSLSVDTHG